MRRVLAFLPFAVAVVPWAVLRLLGARDAVTVVTGMLPAGMGPEAFVIGFAYVFAHLVALVCGPPLAVFALVYALPSRRPSVR